MSIGHFRLRPDRETSEQVKYWTSAMANCSRASPVVRVRDRRQRRGGQPVADQYRQAAPPSIQPIKRPETFTRRRDRISSVALDNRWVRAIA